MQMKTQQIDTMATCRTGTACNGNMAWESPFIIFDTGSARYHWHSDNIPFGLSRFGLRFESLNHASVGVSLLVRQGRDGRLMVWRVKRLYAL
jgi:hypothetical protein